MLLLYIVLIFALIFMTDICWIGDKKSHFKHVLCACEVQISDF